MHISSASAVRSVSPTVQPTAKNQEKASTNRTTPGTAAHPNASQFDQARLFSLAVIPAPKHAPESPILTTATEAKPSPRTGGAFAQKTLAAATLVASSLLPVAGAQSVNQQIATLTGIANGLLNATATNEAQIEKLANITTVLTRLTAQNHEDNALTRRVGEDAATRAETALARIELIAGFALAVAAVIFIPYVIRLINSAISKFSPATPTPPAPLTPALVEEDSERGSNHSSGIGSWANQPFGIESVAIDLDASRHSSHHLNLGEEKAGDSESNRSASSLNSHASDSDDAV